jgi:hypothetical protein
MRRDGVRGQAAWQIGKIQQSCAVVGAAKARAYLKILSRELKSVRQRSESKMIPGFDPAPSMARGFGSFFQRFLQCDPGRAIEADMTSMRA